MVTTEQNTDSKTAPKAAIPQNWDGKNIYAEFFKAFERGEAHQRKKDKDQFEEAFMKNISKATTLSRTIILTAAKDAGVDILSAYLRVEEVDIFETLFLVDRKDYLSKKISKIYEEALSVKSDFNCKEFRINFKFMPMSDDLNYDNIHSDGFTLQYGREVVSKS